MGFKNGCPPPPPIASCIVCVYRVFTGSDDVADALGAVAGAPLGGHDQHVHLSTREACDVTVRPTGGAAGGLSIGALQRGGIGHGARAGRPRYRHRAVLTAHVCFHVLRRAGRWPRDKRTPCSYLYPSQQMTKKVTYFVCYEV